MGGSRFQTQADLYAAKAITIPANGAAATLLSLIGTLEVLDSNGQSLGNVASLLHRVTGVRIVGHAAAYLYGRTAATAVIPVAATAEDLDEAVAGQVMMNSFFQSTDGSTVAAVAEVYID